MATSQDTEITLGTGKLLVFFFALVIVCALFFGLGFSLGRNASAGPASVVSSAGSQGGRPTAATTTSQKPAADELLQSVEQKTPDALSDTGSSIELQCEVGTRGARPPLTLIHPAGGIVQVAAVTKPEDAEALVNALKKKQYPAFAVNNTASDKLYRVQVGPYPDIKDAEAIRTRLVSDGYNPILKK